MFLLSSKVLKHKNKLTKDEYLRLRKHFVHKDKRSKRKDKKTEIKKEIESYI